MSSIKSSANALSQAASSFTETMLTSLTAALNANVAGNSDFSNLLTQADNANGSDAQKHAIQNANNSSATTDQTQQNTAVTNGNETQTAQNPVSYGNSAVNQDAQKQATNQSQSQKTSDDQTASSSNPTISAKTATPPVTTPQPAVRVSVVSASSVKDLSSKTSATSDQASSTPTDPQTIAMMAGTIPTFTPKTQPVVTTPAGQTNTPTAQTANDSSTNAGSTDSSTLKTDMKDVLANGQQIKSQGDAARLASASAAAASADDVSSVSGSSAAPSSATSTGLQVATSAGATDKLSSLLTMTSDANQAALGTQSDFTNILNASALNQGAAVLAPQGAAGQLMATSGQSGLSLDMGGNQQQTTGSAALAGNTASSVQDVASASAGSTPVKSSNPYSFASQLTATRASTTGFSTAVDQVVLQLNRSAKDGNDQMTLQLHPADLGRVNIKLDIASDGKVTGTVTADNRATLDLLAKDSRSLERSLQDAGLQADSGSLQFNMSGQSGQAFNQSSQQSASAGLTNPGAAFADTTADGASVTPVAETYYLTPSGVNLSV